MIDPSSFRRYVCFRGKCRSLPMPQPPISTADSLIDSRTVRDCIQKFFPMRIHRFPGFSDDTWLIVIPEKMLLPGVGSFRVCRSNSKRWLCRIFREIVSSNVLLECHQPFQTGTLSKRVNHGRNHTPCSLLLCEGNYSIFVTNSLLLPNVWAFSKERAFELLYC